MVRTQGRYMDAQEILPLGRVVREIRQRADRVTVRELVQVDSQSVSAEVNNIWRGEIKEWVDGARGMDAWCRRRRVFVRQVSGYGTVCGYPAGNMYISRGIQI